MADKKTLLLYSGLFLCVLLWAELQSQIRITADAAWLTQAAQHFLSGQKMADYYFETNPPMSVLIYIPAALMKMAGLESWRALDFYTWALVLVSAFLTFRFLKDWDISPSFRFLILAGFFAAVTLTASLNHAQRDHFIAIALLSFTLAQLNLTYFPQGNKTWRFFTFLLFCPFILLKPHYGLLPVAMLAHRFYRNRDFKIIFNADFVVLSMGVLLYALVMILYFPDFFELILPASLDFYVGRPAMTAVLSFVPGFIVFAFCLAFLAFAANSRSGEKNLAVFLGVMALLAVIPYWVQNKGFGYHLLPYAAFLFPALLCTIRLYLPARGEMVFCGTALGVFAAVLTYFVLSKELPRHDFLKEDRVVQLIETMPAGSSFYIEHYSTDVALPISEYHGRKFASRFPALWFTGFMYAEEPQRDFYYKLFGDLIAEDFKRYRPEIVLLIDDREYYNIRNMFSDHPAVKEALGGYREDGAISSENILYPLKEKVPVPYKIYRRIQE